MKNYEKPAVVHSEPIEARAAACAAPGKTVAPCTFINS